MLPVSCSAILSRGLLQCPETGPRFPNDIPTTPQRIRCFANPIAFYQSPAGTAFVEKKPLASQREMPLMQERTGPLIAKLTAAAEELKAQAKEQK